MHALWSDGYRSSSAVQISRIYASRYRSWCNPLSWFCETACVLTLGLCIGVRGGFFVSCISGLICVSWLVNEASLGLSPVGSASQL